MVAIGKCLQVAEEQKPDLIIMGKQSIDGDYAQTGGEYRGDTVQMVYDSLLTETYPFDA